MQDLLDHNDLPKDYYGFCLFRDRQWLIYFAQRVIVHVCTCKGNINIEHPWMNSEL